MRTVAEEDRRIERLLADAEAATGPVAWPRVEALVTALVDFYGRALARVLDHARAAAPAGGSELDGLLERDEMVASVLVLHGLHPVPVEKRLDRALEVLRAEVPNAAPLALVGLDDGIATLRVDGPGAPPTLQLVARAVELHAPELTGLRVLGLEDRSGAEGPALLPADRLRRGAPR